MMTKLTDKQKAELWDEMVKTEDTRPVRFLKDGQALSLGTGELCSKGSNVIHHPVYWNFTKETVKKICEWLGVKPVWDKK